MNVQIYYTLADIKNHLLTNKLSRNSWKFVAVNVILLTNEGYYQQIEGLAMGSPPAPLLANGWMNKFDSIVSSLFARYMDDYVRDIKTKSVKETLKQINELHPALKSTMEVEDIGSLPFLDTLLQRDKEGNITSRWYSKKTDTGLVMNYHSLALEIYKRSVVCGMVH